MRKNKIICTSLEDKYTKGVTKVFEELISSKNNLLVIDNNSYIYDKYKDKLSNLIYLDLNEELTNDANRDLLEKVYEIYKEGNVSTAIEILTDFANVIFNDDSIDPFWNESASSWFIGASLYMFRNEEKVSFINLYNKVSYLVTKDEGRNEIKEFIEANPTDAISLYLDGIAKMPMETKGGVHATFNQKLRKVALRMRKYNFDTILESEFNTYIVKDYTAEFSKEARLIYVFLKRIAYIKTKHINILLPNIDTYERMNSFKTDFNAGPSMDVTYYLITSSIDYLKEQYTSLIESVSDIETV